MSEVFKLTFFSSGLSHVKLVHLPVQAWRNAEGLVSGNASCKLMSRKMTSAAVPSDARDSQSVGQNASCQILVPQQ
jgi:hypothetical protein